METDSLADEDVEQSRSVATEQSTKTQVEVARENRDSKIIYKKYVRSVNEIRKLRDRISELEKINARILVVLQREVGPGHDVTEILENRESNWKGRAEEILGLQKRLKEVSDMRTSYPNVAVVVDQRRTTELQTRLDSVTKELTESVGIKRAMKARIDQLEIHLRTARTDIKTLLEKDEVNCQLIEELSEKINTYS
jgi:hypothetical protein